MKLVTEFVNISLLSYFFLARKRQLFFKSIIWTSSCPHVFVSADVVHSHLGLVIWFLGANQQYPECHFSKRKVLIIFSLVEKNRIFLNPWNGLGCIFFCASTSFEIVFCPSLPTHPLTLAHSFSPHTAIWVHTSATYSGNSRFICWPH